jgi:sialate O-acetylesterase
MKVLPDNYFKPLLRNISLCLWLPFILFPLSLAGEIRLPSILSDNMVLQQNTKVKIWGWADPQEKISVSASWLTNEVSTLAGKDGTWCLSLQTIQAGGPYTLVISGKNKITLKNILLGEVWLCSGQSNMEMALKWFGGWKNNPADLKDLYNNDYSKVRLCDISNNISDKPLDDCRANWTLADSGSINNFSATAWFFGRELSKALKVPVALITSDWSGTPAEAWTAGQAFLKEDRLLYYTDQETKKEYPEHHNSALFNAMIHPLTNFAIKGAIWYQGESNIYDAGLYDVLFPAMVSSWRDAWKIGDFPFYYVQIAPFNYKSGCHASAFLREAQTLSLDKIPNSGMIVTSDIGDKKDIHPINKQEVGRRLSLLALKRTYHRDDVVEYLVPVFRNFTIEKNSIRISFANCESGLFAKNNSPSGFEISAADMKFVPATAIIFGKEIVVSSPLVTKPVAARYAFTDTSIAVLFNKEGFPANCFRTDKEALFYGKTKMKIETDTLTNEVFAILSGNDKKTQIRYTTDGSVPIYSSALYKDKIPLKTSLVLRTRIFEDKKPSAYIGAYSYHKHKGSREKLQYITRPEEKYMGNDYTLCDGIHGSTDFRDGGWQGFLGNDVMVQYNLPSVQSIHQVKVSFLQDMNSWIFAPLYVEVYIADDKGNLIPAGIRNSDTNPHENDAFVKEFTFDLGNISTAKIRIIAKNIGLCPDWHKGAKEKAWLFIDEFELY